MVEISINAIADFVGQELGVSEWLMIDQDRVNNFAQATEDHQWIHVDVQRATSEMGGTIAHGFLVLSLLPPLAAGISRITGTSHALNYGCDRIRFLNPVKTGKRIRLRTRLASVEPKGKGLLVKTECIFEIENEEKPACLVDLLGLYFPMTPES